MNLPKLAAFSSHRQLIVHHGCHLMMEVSEKQRWSKAIFITSFLSVSLSGKASRFIIATEKHCFRPAPVHTHTKLGMYAGHAYRKRCICAYLHRHTQKREHTQTLDRCAKLSMQNHRKSSSRWKTEGREWNDWRAWFTYWPTANTFLACGGPQGPLYKSYLPYQRLLITTSTLNVF